MSPEINGVETKSASPWPITRRNCGSTNSERRANANENRRVKLDKKTFSFLGCFPFGRYSFHAKIILLLFLLHEVLSTRIIEIDRSFISIYRSLVEKNLVEGMRINMTANVYFLHAFFFLLWYSRILIQNNDLYLNFN